MEQSAHYIHMTSNVRWSFHVPESSDEPAVGSESIAADDVCRRHRLSGGDWHLRRTWADLVLGAFVAKLPYLFVEESLH